MNFREYGKIHIFAPRKARRADRGNRGREGHGLLKALGRCAPWERHHMRGKAERLEA